MQEWQVQAMSIRAKIMRGDVDQCSFALGCVQDQVKYNDDSSIDREVQDVDLYDVSPVTYPAYDTTSCEARSVAAICTEIIERRAKEIEKRLSPDELATLRLRVNVAFRGL
jgi:hypothetical protein